MRLESQAKAGYYPTPPRVVHQIAQWLTAPHQARALDPCAGAGNALGQLREAMTGDIETYGIELHEQRAIDAAECLDHSWHADAGALDISPASFGLVYLNPPYDFDDETHRLERRFLIQHTAHLAPGGVLVLIIPHRQLVKLVAYLSGNYQNIHVRAFPKPERDDFDQIVVLAQKRETETVHMDTGPLYEAARTAKPPRSLSRDIYPYTIPTVARRPRIQRSAIDWQAAQAAVAADDAYDDVRVVQAIHPSSSYRARPLTSMRDGHLAQLAAAGLLDNMRIETDAGPVLVKGSTRKKEVTTEESEEQTIVAERLEVTVTTLNLKTGELRSLDSAEYVELLADAKTELLDQVAIAYPPLYTDRGESIPPLKRRPMGRQPHAIKAAAFSIKTQRATTIIGEMGVGKSYIAAAAAHTAGITRSLILCPPHLTRKWKREVEATVPSAVAIIATTMTQIDQIADSARDLPYPLYIILSREKAKLGYRWRQAAIRQRLPKRPEYVYVCPDCAAPVRNRDNELQTTTVYLDRARRRCAECSAALWTPVPADNPKKRARYPLAEYIARRHRHLFELLILDEVHEYKAGGSAQGIAAATLSNVIPRTIALTGTYAGGYASTLFHLLYRFSPHIRNHYEVNDVDRWVQEYGFVEKITKTKEHIEQVGSYSRRSTRTTTRKRERPGILPQALHHILGHSIFLRLSDIAHDLPPYREFVQRVDLNDEQEHAYRGLETSLTAAVGAALASGSPRLLGAYLQALLSYPDACTKEEIVIDPADDEGLIIGQAPALSAETRYPKEQALAALYRRERDRGRRVLVFATHTESRDITPRIAHILKEAGATPTVLKSHTVTPDKRENWIAERVTEGTDALILHPRLVQTGLDLLDFPTIIWYEPDYSIYTIRQASRRSWRIGQTEPVEVHHIIYSRTMQAAALALVASKMSASKAIDGDIDASPLDAQADTGDSMIMELARSLVAARPDDEPIPYFEEQEEDPDTLPDFEETEEAEAIAQAIRILTTPATITGPEPAHRQLTLFDFAAAGA